MKRYSNLIFCMLLILFLVNACNLTLPQNLPIQPANPEKEQTATISPVDAVKDETFPSAASEQEMDYRYLFRDGLVQAEQHVLDELPGASEYVLDVTLSDDLATLEGSQVVRYTNREEKSLDEIYFRLFANTAGGSSRVANLTVDGSPVSPVYEYEDSAMRIPLDTPLQPGETTIIAMEFVVEIPREMGGNYGLFGFFEDVLVLDEFYPVIPVYDDEGWNVELPPPNADLPYYDAAFYQVKVTAPPELILAASGVEVSREETAEMQAVTYAAGPARGFYIAGSEKYTRSSLQVGETTVHCYVEPAYYQAAERALEAARGALSIFGETLGTYPYTELDIVSTPMLALGMEYPGLTAISSRLFIDPERLTYLESTVAHEIGHQWFFNLVGNDQVDHPWLDEALVQYLTYLYFLDFRGPEAAEGFVQNWYDRWERTEKANIPIGLAAREYSGTEYSSIVYGRGPIFIKTLSEQMGSGTFDDFLNDYARMNWWEIGTPQEFKQLAEEYCGCSLTVLFDEWVNP